MVKTEEIFNNLMQLSKEQIDELFEIMENEVENSKKETIDISKKMKEIDNKVMCNNLLKELDTPLLTREVINNIIITLATVILKITPDEEITNDFI